VRVSYNWLKEYVEVDRNPVDLAAALTQAGIAVEQVEEYHGGLEGVVIGRIMDIEPHPHAEHLKVCKVSIGANSLLTLVSGAPNLACGILVPVAVEGAVLPGGKAITNTVFRGILSQGMLCSAVELGLPDDGSGGIMVLPGTAQEGLPVSACLGLADSVMVLELTPNRADCLAMVNVAREVAAITGSSFKPPETILEPGSKDAAEYTKVDILEPELCQRYVAKIIEGVTVGPSPAWMRHRLEAAGIRSINNIVDVTNYVMLEMGQPLHAFDYHTLAEGRIEVRRARTGEEIISLDGVTRVLDPEMLVIADGSGPVAIAGVMGGLATEITGTTTTVLLESAHFHPQSIRKTSRRLSLRSESSMRFEKGVDLAGCRAAADRAAQLMVMIGGGRVAQGAVDVFPGEVKPVMVNLRIRRVNEILGTTLTMDEVASIMDRLSFPYRVQEGLALVVSVPTYRGDIGKEIDLIEEVARLYGYHLIPSTLPHGPVNAGRTRSQRLEDRCHTLLEAMGLTEVITYSFINPSAFDRLQLPPEHPWRTVVEIRNPLSEEQRVMRPTLLHGLLEVAARNTNRRMGNLALFEIGRAFVPQKGKQLPDEPLKLGVVATGEIDRGWQEKPLAVDFYMLKGVLEELLGRLGLDDYDIRRGEHPSCHPGRTGKVSLNGTEVGFIGELHPAVMEEYGLTRRCYVFELDLGHVAAQAADYRFYKAIPRFPSVTRDVALLVDQTLPASDVERVIIGAGGPLLQQVRLFDVYQGGQVPPGKRSLAYSLMFQNMEKTLTDGEVNAIMQVIRTTLVETLGAELR